MVDDETLAGGAPNVIATSDGLVFAWQDLQQLVVATLSPSGAFHATLSPTLNGTVGLPGLARVDDVTAAFVDHVGDIAMVGPGGENDLGFGESASAIPQAGAFLVASSAQHIALTRATLTGDAAGTRSTSLQGFAPTLLSIDDSRLFLAAVRDGGAAALLLDATTLEEKSAVTPLMSFATADEDTPVAALSLGDRVLLAIPTKDGLITGVFDLTSGSFGGQQTLLANNVQFDRPVSLARASDGTIGVCVASTVSVPQDANTSGVLFQRLDETGAAIGGADVIAENLSCTGNCAVGAIGSNFFLLWWKCGGDVAQNEMHLEEIPAQPAEARTTSTTTAP